MRQRKYQLPLWRGEQSVQKGILRWQWDVIGFAGMAFGATNQNHVAPLTKRMSTHERDAPSDRVSRFVSVQRLSAVHADSTTSTRSFRRP